MKFTLFDQVIYDSYEYLNSILILVRISVAVLVDAGEVNWNWLIVRRLGDANWTTIYVFLY